MDIVVRNIKHQQLATTTETQCSMILSPGPMDNSAFSANIDESFQLQSLPSISEPSFCLDFEGLPQDRGMPSNTAEDPAISLSNERGQYNSFFETDSSGASAASVPFYQDENQDGNMTYRTRSTPGTSDDSQQFEQQMIDEYQSGHITVGGADYILRELANNPINLRTAVNTYINPRRVQQVPQQPQWISLATVASAPLRSAPWTPESIPQQRYAQPLDPAEAIFFEPSGHTFSNHNQYTDAIGHQTYESDRYPLYEPKYFGPPPPQLSEVPSWPHRIPQGMIPSHQCGLDALSEYYPEHAGAPSHLTTSASEATISGVKRRGGRTKGLSVESRKKAHDIRNIRACWRCFFLRNSCSDHDVCNGCKNVKFHLYRMPCDRSRLSDRMDLILPDVIISEYAPHRLMEFCNEHVAHWSNNPIRFQLTFGYGPPLCFEGVELVPRGPELLWGLQHVTDDDSQSSQLVRKVSPPIGLIAQSPEHDQLEISQYLDDFVSRWLVQWPNSCFEGKTEAFQREMLRLVCQYYNDWAGGAKWHELLRKTLKLQILSYIGGRILTLPNEDDPSKGIMGREAVRQMLLNPGSTYYEPDTSPRMANRQVKSVMSNLYKNLFTEVLTQLEEMIRYRKGDTWGPSFCIMLLLAMIFEDTQISIDIAVQCENTRGRFEMDRAYALERCHDIEANVFDFFIEIFHSRYKTRNKTSQGFNPLFDGSPMYAGSLDLQTQLLADEVNFLKSTYDEFIHSRRTLTDPEPRLFPTLNISRLVSRFLLSFYE
ncbi:MAG: hypothetical protein M1836_007004 [Candelina mexicana]|nr:MAG: hypothetical protein M1836_007004 [Candelina mexicana]